MNNGLIMRLVERGKALNTTELGINCLVIQLGRAVEALHHTPAEALADYGESDLQEFLNAIAQIAATKAVQMRDLHKGEKP